MSDIRELLDRLEKAREVATPGPWAESVEVDGVWIQAGDDEWPAEVYGERRREDAALIVAAVNALPVLIEQAAEAERLRAAVARVEELLRTAPERRIYQSLIRRALDGRDG